MNNTEKASSDARFPQNDTPPANLKQQDSGIQTGRKVTHTKTNSGGAHKTEPAVAPKVFSRHRQEIEDSFKNSKEYQHLKNKFLKIAKKNFENIYHSNFQAKNDPVRKAFIEKHADELMESFLSNIEIKPGDEVIGELHAAWEELLGKMFPKDFDFKQLDNKHPFGDSGLIQVRLASIKADVTFFEKDGHLSAQVGNRVYQTKDSGLKGILRLQSDIYLTHNHSMDVGKKTLSKCHSQALNSLVMANTGKACQAAAGYLQIVPKQFKQAFAKEEKTQLGIESHEAAYESTKISAYEIPKLAGDYSVLSTGTAVTGGVAIEFGAVTLTEGLLALGEALHMGISNREFLNLYEDFKVQFDTNNPALSDRDRFNLKELEEVARTMKNYGKVKSVGTEGSLHVLLGSAKILAGTGLVTHVSVLAASGTGLVGGLLIVSGGVEMAAACKKLQKLEKRSTAIENTKQKTTQDGKAADYEAGLSRSFLELQADMISNEKTREKLSLISGGGMVSGGTLLVAATVAGAAGAAGFGVGAAAVLGGVALFYVGGQGYLHYKDHQIEELQTKLLAQDTAQVRAAKEKGINNPYKNMQSTAGKLMELHKAVQAEQKNNQQDKQGSLSKHLIQEYMGIHPEQFLSVMKKMDLEFMSSLKDEKVISTGMFIKNEGLSKAALTKASHVKQAGIISGYKVKASLAELTNSKKQTERQQVAAIKSAELKIKQDIRLLSNTIQAEEDNILKENEIFKKQSENLATLSKDMTTATKASNMTESVLKSLKPSNLKNITLKHLATTKNLLFEATALALQKKPVWEANANAEFQAQDVLEVLNKEITHLEGVLQSTIHSKNFENRVDSYNDTLEQIKLLSQIKKETTQAIKLFKDVVSTLREGLRSEYAIKDSNLRLTKLNQELKLKKENPPAFP